MLINYLHLCTAKHVQYIHNIKNKVTSNIIKGGLNSSSLCLYFKHNIKHLCHHKVLLSNTSGYAGKLCPSVISVFSSLAQRENGRCGLFTFLRPSTKDPLHTHTKEQGEGFLEDGREGWRWRASIFHLLLFKD